MVPLPTGRNTGGAIRQDAKIVAVAMLRISLVFLLGTVAALAQTTLGSITGRVTDATSAGIAQASVTATNTATAIPYKTVSSAAGTYVLSQLPVGLYDVSIGTAGFKRYIHKAVRLNVAQTVTLDASLELGAVDQTVNVSGDVSTLQTSTSRSRHHHRSREAAGVAILCCRQAA